MHRHIISDLKQWFSQTKRRPLVLRGARQVGKSTSVRSFAKDMGFQLLEINLEKHLGLDATFSTFDMQKIYSALEDIFKKSLNQKNALLFLDEIQATPHAIPALRYFFEERPHLPVIAAGSLLDLVLGQADLPTPVGRIQYLHMGPLTFEEFLIAKNEHWFLEKLKAFQLGMSWSNALHEQGIRLVKEFTLTGGMPAAVAAHIESPDTFESCLIELQSIVDTYKEDFAKYTRRGVLLPILQKVYETVPRDIGKCPNLSKLVADARHSYIKDAIGLLVGARILTLARPTDAQGIPLAAGARDKGSKVFFVDIGLVNRLLRLDSTWISIDSTLSHTGPLAEQFVAQHLCYFESSAIEPALYYWTREIAQSNAEVDFLLQMGPHIIPVEVKSGATGTLKSLHQYLLAHKAPFAVRFNSEKPVMQKIAHAVLTKDKTMTVNADLISLPLYMICELRRLIVSQMK